MSDELRTAQGNPGQQNPGQGNPGQGNPGQGNPGRGQPGQGYPGQGEPEQERPGRDIPDRDDPDEEEEDPDQENPGRTNKPGSVLAAMCVCGKGVALNGAPPKPLDRIGDEHRRIGVLTMKLRSLVAVGAGLIILGSAAAAAASAKPNEAFLTDVIQGNLAEISLGQLAQKNGASEGVRSFGQMLVEDHSAANDKARSLADAQGVSVPRTPKPEAKQELDKLSNLKGEAFDKQFAEHMVNDHQKDIAEFEAQANGTDEVASFARDTLPTLQKHLKTAKSLGKSAQ